jgi:ABC-type branched-subunit amino acid transport system substrate-binding protein
MQSAPGVTADAVQIAIVVQPGVGAGRRQAVVRVIQQLFDDINAGQQDAVRSERVGQVRLGRTFRPWRLQVWQLQGASRTWAKQLEDFYRRQPVFALVSGLGDASWKPIHDFAEYNELPCILPQTSVPDLTRESFYTVYLNRGVVLEAQALARYLHDQVRQGPIVQVSVRGDDAGASASAAFRVAFGADGTTLRDVNLPNDADDKFWRELSRQNAGATLVLWLRPAQLAHAGELTSADSGIKDVYLSTGMGAANQSMIRPDVAGRLRLVWPEDLPAARRARLDNISRWMRAKGIELTDPEAQYNAYLAATVTGMVAMHTKDAWSRELLLERMEHRLGTALELSMYPHISLGPGQRFASKGSYIVQLNPDPANPMTAISDWIVP